MHREFFTTALTLKPELLRAMLAFNGVPAFPPLPEQLAGLPQADALWANAAVRRRFGGSCPADPDFWDFEDEVSRLAFLDAVTLERLALTFGVAVMAPEICRLLRREAVHDARERLGEALYAYALHRARFQVQGDVVPTAVPMPENAPVNVRAYAVGAWGLRALTSRCPEPIRGRFVLEHAPPDTDGDPVLDADQHRQLWAAMKKILLKEVAPSWTPCFD